MSVTATAAAVELPTQIRLSDGRVYTGPLPLERHRAVQLGLLHTDSTGYVEITPGTRPVDGKIQVDRRTDERHFLPLTDGWLERALEHVDEILANKHLSTRKELAGITDREEVFVGVTPRNDRKGNKPYVDSSRFLWVDVDQPEELPKLWQFLTQRPAHLVLLTGGSGGAHAYWKLAAELPSRSLVDESTGEVVEWIERANQRLIHHLGRWITVDEDGQDKRKFIGADRACADRSRIMRLAGTQNWKTGEYARILWADFALPAYDIAALVGHLPDMPQSKAKGQKVGRRVNHDDPYKRIPPPEYVRRLAGVDVPKYGLVSCVSPDHRDKTPSMKVGTSADEGFYCHGCGCGGGIYDFASFMEGGPTGPALRGEEFKQAVAKVKEVFGEQ